MNRKLRFLCLALAGTLLAPQASFAAKPITVYQSMVVPMPRVYANQGFFYSMHLGTASSNTIEFNPEVDGQEDTPDSIGLPNTSAEINASLIVGGTVGFRYERWRPEVELSYYTSKIRSVSLPPAGFDSAGRNQGNLSLISVMFNTHWDFHWTSGINPFIGAGLGFAITNYNVDLINNGTQALLDGVSGTIVPLSQSGFSIAYQFIAGLGYMFTDHLEADFMVKYFSTKLDGFTIDKDLILAGKEVKFDPSPYNIFALEVEFRYTP